MPMQTIASNNSNNVKPFGLKTSDLIFLNNLIFDRGLLFQYQIILTLKILKLAFIKPIL